MLGHDQVEYFERNAEVIHEGQDFGLVFLKPIQQVLGRRLLLASAFLGWWLSRGRVGCQTLLNQFIVTLESLQNKSGGHTAPYPCLS